MTDLNMMKTKKITMNNQNFQTRLYFTTEKICIGSYDEVARYEQETGQSYWASDFFNLPPDYNPVRQRLDEIEAIQKQYLMQNKSSGS